MQIHWINPTNIYKAVEPLASPLDTMPITELTEHALELQDEADRAQRTADTYRSVLYRRRRQAIAAGVDVPDSSQISGLPGWREQQTGELIAESNAAIDREAAQRGR